MLAFGAANTLAEKVGRNVFAVIAFRAVDVEAERLVFGEAFEIPLPELF